MSGTIIRWGLIGLALFAVAACGGGGGDGGGGDCTVSSISLSPSSTSIAVGNTKQFTATGNCEGGGTSDVTTLVTWSSSDQTVATISSAGVATALAEGTTTIGAALGSLGAQATLVVSADGGGDGGTTYPPITWTSDGANWTERTFNPPFDEIVAGTPSAGTKTWIAVNLDYAVIYRKVGSGGSWNRVWSGGHSFLGVAFGGGRFVAITNDTLDGAWVSDGTTDGKYEKPCHLADIVHDGSQFVLLCGNNDVYTSTDGVTWTLASTLTGGVYNPPEPWAMIYAGGKYVVLDGQTGNPTGWWATSPAGPWSNTDVHTPGGQRSLAVVYDSINSRYVFYAGNNEIFYYPADFSAATDIGPPPASFRFPMYMMWDGAQILGIAFDGTGVYTSTDSGDNWTGPASVPVAINGLTMDGSTYFAAGDYRSVLSATSLASWVVETGGASTQPSGGIVGIAEEGGTLVAASNSLTFAGPEGLFVSTDGGANWSLSYDVPKSGGDDSLGGAMFGGAGFTAWGGDQLALHIGGYVPHNWSTTYLAPTAQAVVHDNDQYWIAGDRGMILSGSSVTGDLTVHRTGATDGLRAIATVGINIQPQSIVAVGYNGAIAQSADGGATWSTPTPVNSNRLNSITYGALAGAYVAVGFSTILYADQDATSWTAVSSPPSANYTQVIHDNTQFVAVGDGGRVVTGTTECLPDCSAGTWTQLSTGLSASLTLVGVAKIGTTYMVVASTGAAFTSTNLTSWTATASTGLSQAYSITASQGLSPEVFLINGQGKVVTSQTGASWTTVTNPTVSAQTVQFGGVYGGPFEYIAISSSYGLWSSPGTIAWSGGYGSTGALQGAVAWSGQYYVGVLGDRLVLWNGADSTWTAEVVSLPAGSGNPVSVATYGTKAVATDGSNLMYFNFGGSAWSLVPSLALSFGTKVFHAGNKFLASSDWIWMPGEGSGVLTSPDGVTWTEGTLYEVGPILDAVTHDGAQFVAAGCTLGFTTDVQTTETICGVLVSADNGLSWTGYDPELPVQGSAIAPAGFGYILGGNLGLTTTRGTKY